MKKSDVIVPRLMATRLRASVAVFALTLTAVSQAAPYKPDSNEVLLELDAAQRSASAAYRASTHAADPQQAATIAGNFIALGRAQHDERYFGYASATLQPWRDDTQAPITIALLRADIAQHQHRFLDALGILDVVLARDTNSAEAHLKRASLLMTLGRPVEARKNCQRLFALRESFAGTVCLTYAASLSGQLTSSYRLLGDLLRQLDFERHDQQHAWALGIAADMAERSGDIAGAEHWLRLALKQSPNDLVARLDLCDVLLQTKRAEEVVQLLSEQSASEPVLLRRALADMQLGSSSNALRDWQTAVKRSEQLGVTLHLRELARGQLELLHEPRLALETATRNWEVQREPIDARLLVDAANAAGKQTATASVREWQQALRFEDKGLSL